MASIMNFAIYFFAMCIFGVECLTFDERVRKLDGSLQSVRVKNAIINEQIGNMDTRLAIERSYVKELQERFANLEAVEQAHDDTAGSLQFKLSDRIRRTSGDVSSMDKNKRQLQTATVCFSAVISQADLTNLNSGTPIIFDKEITNFGQGYDVTSGEFTAPISGLYVFNMDIMVMNGENEYLQFVKDNAHVMYNYAHASGALHDESSSRMVVLELKTGNKVWVRTSPSAHHGSGNLHGNGFSTFSGWLLAITE